ncbi:hypothetical protein CKO16_17725 [Rhodoblastus acidophilus]|nr:hypothetical protein CKO16_17725 [Rhodoblastus acidophilus]
MCAPLLRRDMSEAEDSRRLRAPSLLFGKLRDVSRAPESNPPLKGDAQERPMTRSDRFKPIRR